MEFFIYLLLILIVALSPLFGIYLSLVAFEELPELYDALKFFRTILIISLVAYTYFLDVNVYYKIIFSALLVIALGIKIVYHNPVQYEEYLLFILFGFVIGLSLHDYRVLLPVSILIIMSNFLLSSIIFNENIAQKDIKMDKFKIYRRLISSMSVFISLFIASSILFYYII
jgi:hypothetical protein